MGPRDPVPAQPSDSRPSGKSPNARSCTLLSPAPPHFRALRGLKSKMDSHRQYGPGQTKATGSPWSQVTAPSEVPVNQLSGGEGRGAEGKHLPVLLLCHR